MIWKETFFIWVCVRAKWISCTLLLTVVWFKCKSIAFTVSHLLHVKWGAHCNFLWVQVLLAFFVHAFCLGRMQNFWVLEQCLGHAQLISFCGHLQIPSAAYWVMEFCGMYLDAFLHVMPVATARPYGRSTICQYKSYSSTLFHCLFPLCFNYPFVHGFVSLYIPSLSCIDHFSFYWFIPRIRLLFLRFVSRQGRELIPAI